MPAPMIFLKIIHYTPCFSLMKEESWVSFRKVFPVDRIRIRMLGMTCYSLGAVITRSATFFIFL